MDVKERPKCPKCQNRTGAIHCDSSTCGWHICGKCPRNSILVTVFDRKGRSFEGPV